MYNEQAHYIGTNNKYYVIRNGIVLVNLSNVVVVVACNTRLCSGSCDNEQVSTLGAVYVGLRTVLYLDGAALLTIHKVVRDSPGVDDLDKFGFLGVVGDDGQRLDQVRYGDDQVALILLKFLRYLDEHERVSLVGNDDAQFVQRQAMFELVRLAAGRVQHVQRLVRGQQGALAGLVPTAVVFHCLARVNKLFPGRPGR